MSLSKEKTTQFWVAVIFLVTAFFLWKQFSTVMVYYDDYAYYSLIYGVDSGHVGNTYTFGELLSFIYQHYFHTNGRILYDFIWLTIYCFGGLAAVQTAAALCTVLVLFLLWKITVQFSKAEPVSSAFLLCAFYWLLSVTLHRQGTYWFAAFWAYLPPLIPLLMFCLFYFKGRQIPLQVSTQILMVLLIFCAAFSQEQIGVSTVCFTVMIAILAYREKKLTCWHPVYVGASVSGMLLVVLDPAIQARGVKQSAGELPFVQQTAANIKALVGMFFSPTNQQFLTVLFTAIALVGIMLFLSKEKRWVKLLDALFSVLCGIAAFLYGIGYAAGLIDSAVESFPLSGLLILSGLILTVIIVQVSRFYLKEDKYCHLLLFYTAFLSIACLSVVSELPVRLMIFPIFLFFLLTVDGLTLVRRLPGRAGIYLLLCICLFVGNSSWKNGYRIYQGYRQNQVIHLRNDQILRDAAQRIAESETISEIKLQKLPDIVYSCDMAYCPGFEYMTPWIDIYYGIPLDVSLNYLDYDPTQKIGQTLDTCVIEGGAWDDGWLEKDSQFMICSGDEGILHVELYQPLEEYQSMAGIITVDGSAQPFALTGELTTLDVPVQADSVLEVSISMEQEFSAENGDLRMLSVLLSNLEGR